MSQPERHPFNIAEVVAGTVVAGVMATLFVYFSPGWSLVATFVPGLAIAYVTFLIVAPRGLSPGSWNAAAPIYFAALALQCLHCAEEYWTGFPERFPPCYGGDPFPRSTFVVFNLAAYSVFILAALAAFRYGNHVALVPVLFFAIYGTWGNAVSHTTWCVLLGTYFPGALTGFIFFLVGPFVLHAILGSWRIVGSILLLTTVTLVLCALSAFRPV